ncbi:MAG: PD40 domain-containing protein, partial [Pyrinomonadaceae bacterium]|nr:PD40 domain-containing protein [Pyrinomonadaceae bacterium]
LAAAHEAGIVHRDIKPENVMLRADGFVKVLDFGLVKLTERQPSSIDTEASTRALVNTEAGVVMGTASYMSPEQARGLLVDARTDIWSLGTVIYEMAAGRVPFGGDTITDVIASIVKTEPPPLSRLAPEAPAELERIVTKSLAKDREERYQGVKDLLVDLRRLKKRLDFEVELERSAPPEPSSGMRIEAGGGRTAIGSSEELAAAASTRELGAARTTSSAEYLMGEIKRHKAATIASLAVLVMMIAAVGLTLYKFTRQSPPNEHIQPANAAAPSQAMKISRLTTNGRAWVAAISPDGKYAVHVINEAGQQSMWVRQVATSSNVQIIPPADTQYNGITFSNDGDYIYYLIRDGDNPLGAVFQMPVLGGASRRVVVDIGGPVTFSPDGQRLAFMRDTSASASAVVVANADGTGERVLAERKGQNWFDTASAAWSPDGKTIACIAGSSAGRVFETVITVQVEDGAQKEFTSRKWLEAEGLVWQADGSGLVLAAAEQGAELKQIWQLSYPGGEARRITNDFNDYGSLSLAAGTGALTAVQSNVLTNVWTAPDGEISRAKQITSGNFDGWSGIAWTPDGRLAYASMVTGNLEIWIMAQDGTGQKQLTNDPNLDYTPVVSPDGRYIVFVSNRSGTPNLWRMDMDGGNLKQLTVGSEDFNPQISPDGQWVIFDSWDTGTNTLYKISINGGEPVQLTDKFTFEVSISPDGKSLACFYVDAQPGSPRRIIIMPFAGGAPLKTFDVPPTVDADSSVHWTPDGHALLYFNVRGGSWNLWSQPADGGKPAPLTDFKSGGVFRIAWSRDGKQVALTRGSVSSDVVLIRDFK